MLWEDSGGHPTLALHARCWLGRRLAEGSPGDVYQARDIKLDRPCTVKTLGDAWTGARGTSSPVQRLLYEAEILSRLSHPNIVAMYECSRDKNGHPFLVMEPLDGRDLRSLIDESSLLPTEQALAIVRAVGAALQYAHSVGIVHGNLNPSNIFLHKECRRGALEVEVVKLMNFGLAKQMTRAGASQELQLHQSRIAAPPTYLAPEALKPCSDSLEPRADQWSLAVLAYQLLSGRLPFWDSDASRLRELITGAAEPVSLQHHLPDLPAYLLGAIHRALSKSRDQRYASIADFMRALDGPPAWASSSTRSEPGPDLEDQIEEWLREPEQPSASTSAPGGETAAQNENAHAFPNAQLALQDDVPAGVCDPQPILLPAAPAPPVLMLPRRPGTLRRLWLVGCFGLSMASVSLVAAREYLHASSPLALVLKHPPPSVPSTRVLVTPSTAPTPLVPTRPPQPVPSVQIPVTPPTTPEPPHSSHRRHRMAPLHRD